MKIRTIYMDPGPIEEEDVINGPDQEEIREVLEKGKLQEALRRKKGRWVMEEEDQRRIKMPIWGANN
ncbi:hypothetical protein ILUMI_22164 [Ignelater luminosus]|uniref:Uncharacterized protein n=1 Tax=Ignelater luminosus TaxID=2038154 RepID=A0A8K0CEF2_IGNLU|nr:hypothetical protein ILUMI_22164 [Ignelater luminosus]